MTNSTMRGFRCWSAQSVAETVYSDIGLLTENADALFLAAHSPIELEHRRGAELGLATSGEAKVLEALTSRIGIPDKNTLVAVTGDSGSGKSHVVRWVRAHLPDDEAKYRLLYVPRAVQTLRELLRRIIEGLPEAEGGDLMKQVDSAFTGVKPGQFQDRLVFEMKYALRWTIDDFAVPEGGETEEQAERRQELNNLLGFRDEEVGRRDGLADLLDLPALSEVLLRPEGRLRQLVDSYFNETSRRDDNDEVFTKEDLPLNKPGISREIRSNRDLLELWQIIGRKPEDALRLLGEALRIALPRATGLRKTDGETLDSLFRKSRKALRAQQKELILIFEDLAMFGLVDGELYDQFATAPGDELAPLRVLFAITDSPYERMPQTVRTRIEHEFRVGDSVLSKPTEFVARYLNLVRVGRDQTQQLWREHAGGNVDEGWMINACDTREEGLPCRFLDECHGSFGTVPVDGLGVVGLYPYSQIALQRAREHLGESPTPRAVLDSCLLTILPEADGNIEQGSYPHDRTRQTFDFKVAMAKDAVLQQYPSADPERMYRALVIWGDEKPLPRGIYDAFALEAGKNSPNPPVTPEPIVVGPTSLENRLLPLFQWQNGERLPEDEANLLRDALRAFTVNRLQLDEQMIHMFSGLGKTLLEDLFNRTSFDIVDTRGRVAGADSIKFKLTRSAEDMRVLAAARWFRDHGHFDPTRGRWQWPEGYDPGQLMIELEDRLDEWSRVVRDRVLEATGGARLAGQAVGLRAVALAATGRPISEVRNLSGVLLSQSAISGAAGPAWQGVDSVALQLLSNLNASEYVAQLSAVRQGDTGEPQLVDPRDLERAIGQFLSEPESSLVELAEVRSDPSLAQQAKLLLDALKGAAENEANAVSEISEMLTTNLDGYTPPDVAAAAFSVADSAKDEGFFRPSDQWRQFRDAVDLLSTEDSFQPLNLRADLAALLRHQSRIRNNRRLAQSLLFIMDAMELTRQECERSGGVAADLSELRASVNTYLNELNGLVDSIERQG